MKNLIACLNELITNSPIDKKFPHYYIQELKNFLQKELLPYAEILEEKSIKTFINDILNKIYINTTVPQEERDQTFYRWNKASEKYIHKHIETCYAQYKNEFFDKISQPARIMSLLSLLSWQEYSLIYFKLHNKFAEDQNDEKSLLYVLQPNIFLNKKDKFYNFLLNKNNQEKIIYLEDQLIDLWYRPKPEQRGYYDEQNTILLQKRINPYSLLPIHLARKENFVVKKLILQNEINGLNDFTNQKLVYLKTYSDLLARKHKHDKHRAILKLYHELNKIVAIYSNQLMIAKTAFDRFNVISDKLIDIPDKLHTAKFRFQRDFQLAIKSNLTANSMLTSHQSWRKKIVRFLLNAAESIFSLGIVPLSRISSTGMFFSHAKTKAERHIENITNNLPNANSLR